MRSVYTTLLKRLCLWGSLVQFSHTVFALPFALAMATVIWGRCGLWGKAIDFNPWQLVWMLVALVTARTAAMTFNRIIDRDLDVKNPRTSSREIPSGRVSVRGAMILLVLSGAIFFLGAAMLGKHCLILAPFVLVFLLFYSLTKRFTSMSHLVLGCALALAPGGVWYALTTSLSIIPIALMCGVAFWVAGFDVLYSCQDYEFDRSSGVKSLPAWLGVKPALVLARLFHALAFMFLVTFGVLILSGMAYYLGLVAFGLILGSQHMLLNASNLRRINAAFFSRNAFASLLYLSLVILDVIVQG